MKTELKTKLRNLYVGKIVERETTALNRAMINSKAWRRGNIEALK
jgi:hypothetical protein